MDATEDGTVPAAVANAMLDEGLTSVAAWRKYRGLSQSELARSCNLSQATIARIESGNMFGRIETRKALAVALNAPLWSLLDD